MAQNINTYLQMLLVQQKVELLSIALNFELFKALDEKEHNYITLAKHMRSNKNNTKILLEGLDLLGLVKEENNIYVNTKLSRTYFTAGKENYCGDLFLHRKDLLSKANTMLSSLILKENEDNSNAKHPEIWAKAAKKNLKQEQKNLISPISLNIVKELKEFKHFKKMLDLGCSSGILSLEFVKNHPSMKAVCFDYKEVTTVVKTHIKEYDLENRVSVISGDIEEDDIGKGYDFIWCSNIFYFIKDNKNLLKKIYDALNPKGVLITCHMEEQNNTMDEASFFYFLFLNLQGKKSLKQEDLKKDFKDVGFKSITTLRREDFPMTPNYIHIVRK